MGVGRYLVVGVLMGCYAPHPNAGAPCGPPPDLACPAGQICDEKHFAAPTCVVPGTVGGEPDAPTLVDDASTVDSETVIPIVDGSTSMPAGPANDLAANAVDVSAGGTFTWDPTNAQDNIASPCAASAGPDVFFKITLAAPEVIYADTFGSSANSVIAIRAGDCTASGTMEACVDNSCGGVTSQGAWNLSAGTHCIVVDQVGATGGTAGKLTVTHGRRAGDPLTGASGMVSGNTCSDDNNNTAGCGCEPAEDHHYFLTVCPGATPTLHVDTCNGGATWDTVLQVRSNATMGSTNLGCTDDSCGVQSDVDSVLTGPGLFWAIVDGCTECGAYTMHYTLN